MNAGNRSSTGVVPVARTSAPASLRDIFSDPASVAVVGASANPAKWGYWLARGALRGRHRRRVHLVNRGGAVVLGESTCTTLSELPEVPELLAVCVPPESVPEVVDEALALGVRGIVGITAGVPDEARIAERVRAAGARMIGMNSLGLFDASTDLQLAWGHFTPGSIAVISQSGQLGSEIAGIAARTGLGISRFVSVGNQTDVRAAQLLEDLVADERTKVVALYLESFAGGQDLIRAIRRLEDAGKRTVVLTVGGSDASSRLARSHTGSMTSTLDVVDAALRVAGAVRVSTPGEVVDVARLLLAADLPAGDRVAIVGDSGGQTGIAADVTSMTGLRVAAFSDRLRQDLGRVLPDGAACTNPVDLAGAGEQDLSNYVVIVERLLDAAEVDAVILTGYFGSYSVDTPALADREAAVVGEMAAAARRVGKPLVVHSMVVDGPAIDAMRDHGIPTYASIETAVRSLRYGTDLAAAGRGLEVVSREPVGPDPGYMAAQEFLGRAGIRFPPSRPVRSMDDFAGLDDELSGPLVLKAAWLEHKSEVGGVRVGLADAAEAQREFTTMHGRLGDGVYVVEEMDRRPHTVEMLLGARQDPHFGPVVVLGSGGTEAELDRDIAMELAPVDRATAADMLARLRCYPLLRGWRGRPPVDIDGLLDQLVALSELAAAHPGIPEIEVNPLRVGPDGSLAVDALIIT